MIKLIISLLLLLPAVYSQTKSKGKGKTIKLGNKEVHLTENQLEQLRKQIRKQEEETDRIGKLKAKENLIDPKALGSFQIINQIHGKPPKRHILQLPDRCTRGFKKPIRNNQIIARKDRLQNVVIWIEKGPADLKYHDGIEKQKRELNISGCWYSPRVLAVKAGSPLVIRNNDLFNHPIFSVSYKNKKINTQLGGNSSPLIEHIFFKPEQNIEMRLGNQKDASSFIHVFNHNFYDVSNIRGFTTFEQLPPGKYLFKAWHEIYGTQTVEGVVTPGRNNVIGIYWGKKK